MDDADRADLTPLILLVDHQDSTAGAIEAVLRPRGNVVLKASTGRQAIGLVEKVSPDAILVSAQLPDVDGVDLIRELRESDTVPVNTPVFITTDSTLGRAQRLEALNAGAWDVLIHPLEAAEFVVRLSTFVRAKQDSDRVREEALTDGRTGFYNVRGVLQRAKELAADASRFERPMTCVAFGPDTPTSPQSSMGDGDFALLVAKALQSVTRGSDTLGKLGPSEFVVVAPGTAEEGALRLADRVVEAVAKNNRPGTDLSAGGTSGLVRAGLATMAPGDRMSPEDLLLRATLALRKAQTQVDSFRVRSFEA